MTCIAHQVPEHVDRPEHIEHDSNQTQDNEMPRNREVGILLIQHLAGGAGRVLWNAEGVVRCSSWMALGWEVRAWPVSSSVWGALPGHGENWGDGEDLALFCGGSLMGDGQTIEVA